MQQFKKRILFDGETISQRVREIGKEISLKYPAGNLLLIGILKGSFIFIADLCRSLDVSCKVDFVRISSYGNGTVTSGKLDIIMDVGIPVRDKNVILVDDIVDSGLTLSEYRTRLEEQQPLSLETAALIDKTARRDKHVQLDYCGFRVEDGFIVGYGLDCDEHYRNLPGLYILE
ncbi:MAG: hypoxanthine phosphoribosyltransferase [Desulfomonilaceae bacterium]